MNYLKTILFFLFLIGCLISYSQIKIQGGHIYNTTGLMYPERYFDNNVTTNADPYAWGGGQVNYSSPFHFWVVLDSIYINMSVERFHSGFGQDLWSVILYDSSRINKDTFDIRGTLAGWERIDLKTKFPVRFIEVRTVHAAANINEFRFWGTAISKASSILPTPKPYPNSPGKYFQGYGKLNPYRGFDDAGWSIRLQVDRNWVDSKTDSSILPSTHIYQLEVTGMRESWLQDNKLSYPHEVGFYFAGSSRKNSRPHTDPITGVVNPYGWNQVKDIPWGWDSTKSSSWINDYGLGEWQGKTFGKDSLIDWYEIGNEDIANWADKLRFHSPESWLEKIRQGALGVRSTGAKIKIVSGALTSIDTSYLKGVYLINYFRYGKDSWLTDVIAINHYATNLGGQNKPNSYGVSPEQAKLYSEWAAFAAFMKKYYPGVEYWWTEFGYDIHNSPYEIRPVIGETREYTQGKMNLRTYEIAAAAKVYRAFMYTQSNFGGGVFATTGFEYSHDRAGYWAAYAKESYYFFTLRAALKLGWADIVRNGDSTGVTVLKYSDSVYSIWKGTNVNKKDTNYTFSIDGVTKANLISVKVGKKYGDTILLKVVEGKITIPFVTETPAYIIVKTAAPSSPDTWYKISKIIYSLDDKTLLLARDVKQRRKSNRTTIIDYTLSDGTVIKENHIIYKTIATKL